jgi:P27 family predicted phage terminase small subunit
MGNWNSGRRPRPTAMKILRGTQRRDRLNPDEPKPAPADFDAVPAELAKDREAAREWARVVPLLRACGIISRVERSALLALCEQWSQYVKATQSVRKHGLLLQHAGIPTVNPAVRVARHALQQCQRLWGELGMTPAARAKLTTLQPDDAPVASKWANDL